MSQVPVLTRSGQPRFIQSLLRALLLKLAVHENVKVGSGVRVGRGVVISSPHGLEIGDYASIGPHTTIQVDGTIGKFALIGMSVKIAGRHDHATNEVGVPIYLSTWVGDRAPEAVDVVHIGRDVWVGAGAVILSNVRIGDGAIIGAGSVVTRDVDDFSIVAGNPARAIGLRFATELERSAHLEKLERIEGSSRTRV